jgi:hypothetical protein
MSQGGEHLPNPDLPAQGGEPVGTPGQQIDMLFSRGDPFCEANALGREVDTLFDRIRDSLPAVDYNHRYSLDEVYGIVPGTETEDGAREWRVEIEEDLTGGLDAADIQATVDRRNRESDAMRAMLGISPAVPSRRDRNLTEPSKADLDKAKQLDEIENDVAAAFAEADVNFPVRNTDPPRYDERGPNVSERFYGPNAQSSRDIFPPADNGGRPFPNQQVFRRRNRGRNAGPLNQNRPPRNNPDGQQPPETGAQ